MPEIMQPGVAPIVSLHRRRSRGRCLRRRMRSWNRARSGPVDTQSAPAGGRACRGRHAGAASGTANPSRRHPVEPSRLRLWCRSTRGTGPRTPRAPEGSRRIDPGAPASRALLRHLSRPRCSTPHPSVRGITGCCDWPRGSSWRLPSHWRTPGPCRSRMWPRPRIQGARRRIRSGRTWGARARSPRLRTTRVATPPDRIGRPELITSNAHRTGSASGTCWCFRPTARAHGCAAARRGGPGHRRDGRDGGPSFYVLQADEAASARWPSCPKATRRGQSGP